MHLYKTLKTDVLGTSHERQPTDVFLGHFVDKQQLSFKYLKVKNSNVFCIMLKTDVLGTSQ